MYNLEKDKTHQGVNDMNETIRTIHSRASIRGFQPTPLTPDERDILSAAALAAPSGMDAQPWHFSFVTDPTAIADVSEAALDTFRRAGNQTILDRVSARHPSLFYGAPLVVFISLARNASAIEAGIAVQTLALAAQSLGLGSCIIGLAGAAFSGPEGADLAARLSFPDGYTFAISIAIGHAAIAKEPHRGDPAKISWHIG